MRRIPLAPGLCNRHIARGRKRSDLALVRAFSLLRRTRLVMQQLGKYQLIRELATGGMAEVFLAKAASPMGLEKTLVVKCILPPLAAAPAALLCPSSPALHPQLAFDSPCALRIWSKFGPPRTEIGPVQWTVGLRCQLTG